MVCLYGDAGQGKTVALQFALSQLPHPARVRRVHLVGGPLDGLLPDITG
ncbi:hypothetical protein [Streptomyces echinatus]